MSSKKKTPKKKYLFVGQAGKNEIISILGKRTTLQTRDVNCEFRVWDLDENGQPQVDKHGDIKVKTINEYIDSVRIWIPENVKFKILGKKKVE